MSDEIWRPVPGYDLHEVSSHGRVRTTAAGTSSSPVMSLAWLLALILAVVAVHYAHLVNTVATAVTLALCAVPAFWLAHCVLGEVKLAWECRGYRRPVQARPAARRAIARAPLAIEAARPTPLVIDAEVERMTG